MKVFNQNHPFVILEWDAFKRLLKYMDRIEIRMWLEDERVISPDDLTMFKQEPNDDSFLEGLFLEIQESLRG